MPVSSKNDLMSESKSVAIPPFLSALEDKSSVRYERRARVSEISDIPGMEPGWKDRLAGALKQAGVSQRRASLGAGLGAGYVNSILKEGKDPTVANLAAVCQSAGISLAYVLFGFEMTAEIEGLIELLERAPASKRQSLLTLLREGDEPSQSNTPPPR